MLPMVTPVVSVDKLFAAVGAVGEDLPELTICA